MHTLGLSVSPLEWLAHEFSLIRFHTAGAGSLYSGPYVAATG
jgi:hypothetical protein